MDINFVVTEDGRVFLAAIFTSVTVKPIALTTTGELLTEGFYILPSDEKELLWRIASGAIEENHFPMPEVLQRLAAEAAYPCDCSFPHNVYRHRAELPG